jgi:branched-subunit amino acid transport protein
MNDLLDISRDSANWGWAILVMTAIGTYVWRFLGVLLSGKLTQDSPLFRWVTCVTYAMVAALVIRIIVLPVGVLAEVPTAYRVVSAATAFMVMLIKPHNLLPAISTGAVMIILLAWLG